jgi:hypothetical protein
MSVQDQRVFRVGFALAKRLENERDDEESEVVLRLLSRWLSETPAMPDRSCMGTVDKHLVIVYARVRAKELKEKH